MSSNLNPTTESSILNSYLLAPSSLPTILPYSAFKTLAQKANPTLKDPSYSTFLRRLYRDLQFQRDITLNQVSESIERECTTQSTILKSQLARQIAIEEGEENEQPHRKRRRVDEDDSEYDEHDDSSSSNDEFSNPILIAAQKAMYHHPTSSHPAAHVMPVEGEVLASKLRKASRSAYHTRASLLREMEDANQNLDEEIAGLERECTIMKSSIKETIGALSDLRYGKRQSSGEDGGDAYKEVVEAIEQFRGVVRASAKT